MDNKKYSLLIVDDERDIVDQLYDFFRKDYQVYKAYDCDEALKILEKEDIINLVMSDQGMPKMQGTEFLARLKIDRPEITRILMTGYTDLEVAIEAINKGSIHRYLSKPLNYDELGDIIKKGMQNYEEAVKIKNLISQEKKDKDIIGKIKNVLSQLKVKEMDKGKLEKELQAAKELETRIQKGLEQKVGALEEERVSANHEIMEFKGKVANLMEDLNLTRAEAEKVKDVKEESMKLEEEMKDLEAKFLLVNKSVSSLKEDLERIKQERDSVLEEKNHIEKKLNQFQKNWGSAMKA